MEPDPEGYDRFLADSVDGTVVLDAVGRVLAVSESFRRTAAYEIDDWVGRNALEFLHPEDAAAAAHSLANSATSAGMKEPLHLRMRDGAGRWRPVEVVANTVSEPETGEVLVVLSLRDHTDRSDHERRLAERSELYRQVVELAAEGVWIIDADNRTSFASPPMAAMLGYEPEEMLGRHVYDFMDAEGRSIVERNIERYFEGNLQPDRFKLLHRDGRSVWTHLNAMPLGTGDPFQGVVAVVTDNTEDHLEHERIEGERARQAALLAALPDMMFHWDSRGRYLDVHAGHAGELEGAPDTLIGLTIGEVLPQAATRTLMEAIGRALSSRELQAVEFVFERDDVPRTYEARISPSGDEDVVAIVRNVTALRQAERARNEWAIEVQRRVAAEQRAELDRRLQRADRLDALGRLSGGVAHDVNNLLGVIGNYAEVLRRTITDEVVLGDVAEIEAAVRRGSELTRRLLLVGRGDTPEPEALPIADTVRSICGVLQRTGDSATPITTELEPSAARVLMDRTRLEQAVVNLVINAQDASRGGRVVVRLTEQVGETGAEVRISVIDDGPGIPDDIRERVVEPFFTTKEPGRGTGLGLAVVHSVVVEAGGRLEIGSAPDGGAELSLVLPVASHQLVAGGDRRILVVDDEEVSLRSTARLLGSLGLEVVTAGSASEAIAAVTDGPEVAAVLTDLRMPGESGVDLEQSLRESRPDLPVVLMTGHRGGTATAVPRDRTLLTKPLSVEELEDVLGPLVGPGADPVQ